MPPLTEPNLDEIFGAFIDAEQNPSDGLLKGLATATGMTEAIIRSQYVSRYRLRTESDDDPFGLPPPRVG
jgi:hypothetical protein